MIKIMKELKRFQTIRRIEHQDARQQQTALKTRIPVEKKINLKKQSQYLSAIMAVKSFVRGDYDKYSAGGIEENKPNQSQFYVPTSTKGVGKREKPAVAASG